MKINFLIIMLLLLFPLVLAQEVNDDVEDLLENLLDPSLTSTQINNLIINSNDEQIEQVFLLALNNGHLNDLTNRLRQDHILRATRISDDHLIAEIFNSVDDSDKFAYLVRNSNNDDLFRALNNLEGDIVYDILENVRPNYLIELLSIENAKLFDKYEVIDYIGIKLTTEDNFKRIFVDPLVVNSYMKKKYSDKINFETNNNGRTIRILEYDTSTGIIKIRGNTEFNLNIVDDARVKSDGCVESEKFGLYCGSSFLGEEGNFKIEGGKANLSDNIADYVNSFILKGERTEVEINGIKYQVNVKSGLFSNDEVKFDFYDDSYTVDGSFIRKNIFNSENKELIMVIDGGISQSFEDKSFFKINQRNTEIKMYLSTSQFLETRIADHHLLGEFKLDDGFDFYTFDDENTNQKMIQWGDFYDPCIEHGGELCISFNMANEIFLSKFDVNLNPSLMVKMNKGVYIQNPKMEIDFNNLYSLLDSYSLSNSQNELSDEIKNKIVEAFLKDAGPILGHYGKQITEFQLKRILNDFPQAENEDLSDFFVRLGSELTNVFGASFDFKIDKTVLEQPTLAEIIISNDPSHLNLEKALEYTDEYYKDLIIDVFETTAMIDGSDRLLTGYIDSDGNLRLPEGSDGGEIVLSGIDLDKYVASLLQGDKAYISTDGMESVISLQELIGNRGSHILENAINNYITIYNEENNADFDLMSNQESQFLANLIIGQADLHNPDVSIRDIQSIFDKIPGYGEILGVAGIDDKLGPETSKTIAAYGQALTMMIPVDELIYDIDVSFTMDVFQGYDQVSQIFDVSGSVNPELMQRQMNLLKMELEQGNCLQNLCFYAYTGQTPNTMGRKFTFDEHEDFLNSIGYDLDQGVVRRPSLSNLDILGGPQLESPVMALNHVLDNEPEHFNPNKNSRILATLHYDGTETDYDNPKNINDLALKAFENNIHMGVTVLFNNEIKFVDLSNPISEEILNNYYQNNKFHWGNFALDYGITEEQYVSSTIFRHQGEQYSDWINRINYYNQQRDQTDSVGIVEPVN